MAEKRKGKGVMFQTLKKMFGGKKEAAEVLSPVSGSVVPLSEVNDPAFAQEIPWKGCGCEAVRRRIQGTAFPVRSQ